MASCVVVIVITQLSVRATTHIIWIYKHQVTVYAHAGVVDDQTYVYLVWVREMSGPVLNGIARIRFSGAKEYKRTHFPSYLPSKIYASYSAEHKQIDNQTRLVPSLLHVITTHR